MDKKLDFVEGAKLASKHLKKRGTVIPQRDETYAYNMGFDCGKNGANLKNCHFSIFNSQSNMKEWERGKRDAEKGVK